MSLGAKFSIRSVNLSKSLADAFSEIHGLHRMLMVITSPAIRSKHRNSGGIGEYTRSFPQFGHRITESTGWWEERLFGLNYNTCAFDFDFENWLWSLRGPVLYFASCKLDSRPAPGTFNHMACLYPLSWRS